VIELLGVGVPRAEGGWLLHRVCTQLDPGAVTLVISRDARERLALLDAIGGVLVPEEGRVYVSRLPVSRDSGGRLRSVLAELDLGLRLAEHRTVLWNTLARRGPGVGALLGFLRFPREPERRAALRALERVDLAGHAGRPVAELGPEDRARLLLARELARYPEYLLVREIDAVLGADGSERLMDLLRNLARAARLCVVASVASMELALAAADRVVVLAEGLLVFDGPPSAWSRPRPSREPVSA
jgi:ABC-type phosphate/phosphonate transport system ATPase subunit